eukprot:153901_1
MATGARWYNLIAVCCIFAHLCIQSTESKSPNIVMIITDDEDQMLLGPRILEFDVMPNRERIFIENGISFSNAFSSSPTCCVSRSSILTGKYVHNHAVTNNSLSGNCWSSQFRTDHEPFTYAAYLNQVGDYNTFHAGKYLNQYGMSSLIGPSAFDIPYGWDNWFSLAGEIDFYNYCVSDMGSPQCFGDDPSEYITTTMRNKAMQFLQSIKTNDDDRPFLLVFNTIAAHYPFTREPKYKHSDDDQLAPRTPNWNIAVKTDGTHNAVLKQQTPMSDEVIGQSDAIYGWRLGTLRSVDDAIGEIYEYVDDELNALDSTYFIYTSDHGFHSGQWAMSYSKGQLYETDIRIPFHLHGPGITQGAESHVFATNVDIAPTILDIAGIEVTDMAGSNVMDGKSLLPYAVDRQEEEAQSFLIEYDGQAWEYDQFFKIRCNVPGFADVVVDSWNNTYACLRWMDVENEANYKYCKFSCFGEGMVEAECEGSVEAKGEFYDLKQDPFEMNNIFDELSKEGHEVVMERLEAFKACVGDECRELYTMPIDIKVNAVVVSHKKHPFDFGASLLQSLL